MLELNPLILPVDCFAPLAVSVLFGAGIFIEIARSVSDAAIQVTPPHSPAPIVRTQSADAANGLPRRAIALLAVAILFASLMPSMDCRAPAGLAVSMLFDAGIFIETARASARGGPSEPAAQSSPDC